MLGFCEGGVKKKMEQNTAVSVSVVSTVCFVGRQAVSGSRRSTTDIKTSAICSVCQCSEMASKTNI